MKSTGIVRRIDPLGRIVIPIELRNLLNIDNGSEIEIFVEKDMIVLSKYKEKCYICDIDMDLVKFKNKSICRKCIAELRE